TSGEGEGKITDVPIGDKKGTIFLKLHGDGERFHFTQPQARGAEPVPPAGLPLLGVALLQEPADAPQPEGFAPAQTVNWLHHGINRAVNAVVHTGTGVMTYLPKVKVPAVRLAPEKAANYLEANLALEDVDVEQLVSGLGVRLPFPVRGRVTFQVQIAIPLDTPRDL